MVISALLITKGNEVQWEKEVANLNKSITTLQGAKINEIYIPVENNYKYGFINENGKEKNSKYYYNNKNYSMSIEPIYDEDEEEIMYNSSSESIKYNVTITKANGEQESNIVSLPGLNESDSTLETFINGDIEFKDEENQCNGWYDNNGDRTVISNKYAICDIKDDKVYFIHGKAINR